DGPGRAPRRDAKSRRDKRVRHLRRPRERKEDGEDLALMGYFYPRRKILRLCLEETQAGALVAGREDTQAAPFASRDDLCRGIAAGIDNSGLAGREQPLKELEFRTKIFVKRCVIVKVVARKIGKGGGREANAIEPALQNAVRGRLQGEMGDTAARQPVQDFVQAHRIWRGQRASHRPRRRGGAKVAKNAKRAERGGLDPERGPNLTHEIGDRRLATGAGDRD